MSDPFLILAEAAFKPEGKTANDPHSCPFPQCKKEYTNRRNMVQHYCNKHMEGLNMEGQDQPAAIAHFADILRNNNNNQSSPGAAAAESTSSNPAAASNSGATATATATNDAAVNQASNTASSANQTPSADPNTPAGRRQLLSAVESEFGGFDDNSTRKNWLEQGLPNSNFGSILAATLEQLRRIGFRGIGPAALAFIAAYGTSSNQTSSSTTSSENTGIDEALRSNEQVKRDAKERK